MSVSIDPDKPNYIGLINESVHTADDADIGDIYAINKYFLVVKRGFINIHYYYIPLNKVEGWDGDVLWLNIPEEKVKEFERDAFPDIGRYYVKGVSYENFPPYVPQPDLIPRRYKGENFNKNINKPETDIKFVCDLCNTDFDNEISLSEHISENHS